MNLCLLGSRDKVLAMSNNSSFKELRYVSIAKFILPGLNVDLRLKSFV